MASRNDDGCAPIDRLLRLKEIIGPGGIIPVSKSTFWSGVKTGRFPQPIKLSPGCTCWRLSDLNDFIARLGDEHPSKPPNIDGDD
jgi:prophage regulatory protein